MLQQMVMSAERSYSIPFAVYTLSLGNLAAGMGALTMAGILVDVASAMEVSTGQAGQLISIYSLVYAIAAPLIMVFTPHIERRTLLVFGLLGCATGNGLAAAAPNYWILFFARILNALGAAAFVPLAAAVGMAMTEPKYQGRIAAVVFTGFTVATALGLPFGTWVGLNFGWRWSFLLVAVLGTLAGLSVWLHLPRTIQTPPSDFTRLKQVTKHPVILAALLVTIAQFAGQMALFAFISPWLQQLTHLDVNGISFMLLLIGLGGIAGNYAGGLMTDRFGTNPTQLVMIILLGVSMSFIPTVQTSLLIGGLMLFVWGAVGQGFISPQLVRLVTLDQSLSSATLSLNSSFINLGLTLGAAAGGIYIDRINLTSLPNLAVAGAAISLVVFLVSWRIECTYVR